MRNQPHRSLDKFSADEADRSASSGGDRPVMRLVVLFVAMGVPVGVVSARLVMLQGSGGEQYIAVWDRTTIAEQPLPARDGRILSSDGQVLAYDRVRFDVAVHYRWLEDPPDEQWLRQRALSRLSRQERRHRDRVQQELERVLEERRRMWARLAVTLDRPQDDLTKAREGIQRRVERIVKSVNRRREDRQQPTRQSSSVTEPTSDGFRWQSVWNTIVSELTTPPQRSELDPLIVQEEIDYHPLAEDVPFEAVAVIESTPSLFPGVTVWQSTHRVYPQAGLASHLIGVRTAVTAEDLAEHNAADGRDPLGYQEGDRSGRNGVERSFEATLRGRRGRKRIVRDRRGEIIGENVIAAPRHGHDVVLTLESELQRIAEELLDAAILPADALTTETGPAAVGPVGGCLVLLDVWTGDILTAAAAPRHDLSVITDPTPDKWQALLADQRRPFFPRVTQMTIPPGSVFKVLTTAAILQTGRIDPDAAYFCQGYLDHPHRNRCYIYRHYGLGHGEMTLADAICQSCNVYFFHAAREIGPQPIAEWARRFGFGTPTGIDIPGERRGHVPEPFDTDRSDEQRWYPGTTLQLAIGQASLTVTPLQIARMMAAIANGGYLVTPHIVRRIGAVGVRDSFFGIRESDSFGPRRTNAERQPWDTGSLAPPALTIRDGGALQLTTYETSFDNERTLERIPGLSADTIRRIREGMRMVVDHPRGTGRHARVDGVPLAAKTGTAEVGGKPDHAWFAGYVPADAPRYAFVVVLEHGGSGGRAAAPIAKQFIEAMVEAGLLARRGDADEAADD